MWWKKWKKKKPEPTVTKEDRYERLRRMSDEEKEEAFRGMILPAHENACKIIEASGQKPEDYTQQTKIQVTVLIYGMLNVMFMENLGNFDLQWAYAVFESIAKTYLHMGGEIERAGCWAVLNEQLFKESPKYDANVSQMVQEGIDLYALLDRPEELAEKVRQIMQTYKEVPDTVWECTAINLPYDSLTEAEQDRLDEERYAEKRNMPEEQKKKIRLSITEDAEAMIEKIVAASGKRPSELTPVTQECMAAIIYGAMCASSVEKLGCVDWDWIGYKGPVLINQFLDEDIYDAIATVKYFRRNDRYKNNPNLYPEIYKLIRFGMDIYPCVDQSEQLGKRIRSVIFQCRDMYIVRIENTIQKIYYESDEVTELDRQDEQRIAEKRKMSPEEKEKTVRLITRDGVEKAKIMIAASGEDFSRCPVEIQLCMGALIFGMLSAMSINELGYGEWGWVKFEMAVIAGSLLGAGPEGGTEMAEYLLENSTRKQNPDVNENIHLLIHYGHDLYFFFDQPERLTKYVQWILRCYESPEQMN